MNITSKLKNGSIIAIAVASLALGAPVIAQQGGQGQQGQGGGSGHGGPSQGQGGGSGQGGPSQGQGGPSQGQGSGSGQGGSSQGSGAGQGTPARGGGAGTGQGGAPQGGGGGDAAAQPSTAQGGGYGGKSLDDIMRDLEGEDDTSDRPDFAGVKGGPPDKGGRPATSGSKKGDLFGDLYVILRDEDGIPILTEEGYVQPIDADGNPIPLDAEGAPIDPSLAIPVELGRLNAGRSPTHVLDQRAAEVVTLLNSALNISLDAAGRIVVTTEFVILRDEDGNPILSEAGYVQPVDADGNPVPLDEDGKPIDPSLPVPAAQKTIDAPLENLAIYVALLTEGTIPGVSDLPGDAFDALVDGSYTAEDLTFAASFLAAASDKSDNLTADEVAYIDAFLGINTTTVGSVTYSVIDYTDYSYDRSDAYASVTANVLVEQPDGSWEEETVNIYDVVFGGVDYAGEDSLSSFAQAAEDARQVIDFLHEYAVPEPASEHTAQGD